MKQAAHCPHTVFDVVDDCLKIGGMALTRLAQRAGGTPFYAYERRAVTQRVGRLRAALPPGVLVHYAVKANPMPAVVQMLAGLVDGLDVASGGELAVALDTPLGPQHISFAGPAKRDDELARAVAAGVLVNLESEPEMERLAIISERQGIAARVAVRINPDFELKQSGMKMGGGAKQFGVDAERVPAMLRRIGQLGLDFVGFHLFCGAQNLHAPAIAESQAKSIDLALQLAGHAPAPLQQINIGGGFGVPYFPGDQPLDLAHIGETLAAQQCRLDPGTRLVLELGRYLVAEAGIYVCTVLERKQSRGEHFLITDGGLHHHLAASGNFGQVIRKNYPVAIGNKMRGDSREMVSVVGPLCTPLDVLAERMELARAEPGDLVVVFQSGAYGPSASPGNFLGHPAVREMVL